ncbi:MAG: hypothetical protein ACFFDN_26910 [Candidatus Hodarchaeota archaeon]
MMFTIIDSVTHAFSNSKSQELRAELYLTIYRKNEISNNYAKTIKNISKISNKIMKLKEKGYLDESKEIVKKVEKLEKEYNKKEEFISYAQKMQDDINNSSLIANRLICRYRQGLMLVDYVKKIFNANSSYGRLVFEILKKLSSRSIIDNLKRIAGNKKSTYFEEVLADNPKLKNKSFLETEQGSLLIESHLILFLIQLYTKDLSEEQLKELLNEIITEIGKGDLELTNKLHELYKGGSLAKQFSTIILQIIRLSVGKGVFMNSAVRISNVILRAIIGKGMSFTRNAIFRKFLARFLGAGPLAIAINIFLFISDVAAFINRRDYMGVVNSIMFLYFLRNENSII